MKPATNAAFLPLTLKFFKGQSRKSLVCPAAATALTDEYVAILNANALGYTIGSDEPSHRTLLEWRQVRSPLQKLDGLTMGGVPVGVSPSLLA